MNKRNQSTISQALNCFILIVLCVTLASSCNQNKFTKVDRGDETPLYNVDSDNSEMNSAIEKANQTLGEFDKALQSKKADISYFALKVKYDVPNGAEHIWIGYITKVKGIYIGVVDNVPENIAGIKMGDTVEVDNDRITDWMYIENNKLRGGYTLRVLRKHLSETERVKFDLESGYTIEEE